MISADDTKVGRIENKAQKIEKSSYTQTSKLTQMIQLKEENKIGYNVREKT